MKKLKIAMGVFVGVLLVPSIVRAESISSVQESKKKNIVLIEDKIKTKEAEISKIEESIIKRLKELESDKVILQSTGVLPKDLVLKGVKDESIILNTGFKESRRDTIVFSINQISSESDLVNLENLEFSLKSLRKAKVIKDNELKDLKSKLNEANNDLKEVSSFLCPTKGVETSPFGWRKDPIGGFKSFHQGLDIAGSGEVWSANYGTVSRVGYDRSAGNYVVVTHGVFNGVKLETKYFHLSRILVSQGQDVSKGQVLGIQGTTGYSTGVHLHFQVEENGVPVNPKKYIK